MDPASFALAFVAGLVSIFSPCVLPIVPIVLATASANHRLGPAALAAGLAVSFTVIGLFAATIGFAIGLDGAALRTAGAILLGVVGIVLLVPRFQEAVAVAGSPAGSYFENRFGGFEAGGLGDQFAIGLLLGAVWAPCVGPTLGAASVLAARGEDLPAVALTMALFGIGAGLPLIALGMLSREAMGRWRSRLMDAGKRGKQALGILLVLIAALVITGADKSLEAAILEFAPQWLINLTTRF